ncbi:MAG: FkbM family methyltransferase [Luteolibacter sp.]|jgi:FkbM family methyltransferase|nr:FkbM family methyltransferase [Luteolibacter sp.]
MKTNRQNQESCQDSVDVPTDDSKIFHAPNGLDIVLHSISETKYVYKEIFEDQVYFRHGVDLRSGETVFDIGANIGLFTIFVKESFHDIEVHAFEPSPPIFDILKTNVAKYGDSVAVYPCGVADHTGEAKFTYYPNYTIMSGLHAGGEQDKEILRKGIRSQLVERQVDPSDIQERSLDRMVNVALGQKLEYLCQLRTISDIIEEKRILTIGLLKIDAEGSEIAILAGIRDEHWKRIRQIVLEIHDPNGSARLTVTTLLNRQGYICVLDEEKNLSGSGIINCYARRPQ